MTNRTFISDHTAFTGIIHINKKTHWFKRDTLVIIAQYCKYKKIARYDGNNVSTANISYTPSHKYFKELSIKELKLFLDEYGYKYRISGDNYKTLNQYTDRKLVISIQHNKVHIKVSCLLKSSPFSDNVIEGYLNSVLSHEPLRLKLVKRR